MHVVSADETREWGDKIPGLLRANAHAGARVNAAPRRAGDRVQRRSGDRGAIERASRSLGAQSSSMTRRVGTSIVIGLLRSTGALGRLTITAGLMSSERAGFCGRRPTRK